MGKRILFLTPQLPYPPQQGTAIRNYNLIAQVARRHEVHLLSFCDPDQSTDVGPLDSLCARIGTVPVPLRSSWRRLLTVLASPVPDLAHRLSSATFRSQLQAWLDQDSFDILQAEGLEMGQFALEVVSRAAQKPRLVFDAHNAEFLLQQRIFQTDVHHPSRWVGALYSLLQWRKLRSYESSLCRRADQVLACSPADAQALASLSPGLRPVIIPNGVDTEHYRPGVVAAAPLQAPALVFTGKMDFRPNVDAILWFSQQVLPRIRVAHPDAHLYVVGKSPHSRLASIAQAPGVTLTGFVDDVRPYIAAAAVYIVPLLTGGGTRLKVLEAMAMAKPMVCTTLGCEGIPAVAGQDLLIADLADAFADGVVTLLRNEALRSDLGRSARHFVEQHFDWHQVTAPLEQVYAQ
jgi:polysaccharide biosynthesis protein PslH